MTPKPPEPPPEPAHLLCPTCGQAVDDPDHYTASDLRFLRAKLGIHYGYTGETMPRREFAWYVGVSPRTLDYYMRGERKLPSGRVIPVRVPRLVARQARALAAKLEAGTLPPLPERMARRKRIREVRAAFWAQRKAAGMKGRPTKKERDEGPPPPF